MTSTLRPLEPDDRSLAELVPLTAKDACDGTKSGSETAQVRVQKEFFTLDFCKNHFERHELALIANGWLVTQDNRAGLS